MTSRYDVAGVGNAIVDIIAPADEAFLDREGLAKGSMQLIDQDRALQLYDAMAPGVEASGGSAANSLAGLASFGGRGAFMGKVADDQLGRVFRHDIRAMNVHFESRPVTDGTATGTCLINVTRDGQRTMTTFLGAAALLSEADVEPETVAAAEVVYLEGYLFDPEPARRALQKAARLAREADRSVALTLSDAFVVERWREDLVPFIDSDVDLLFANEAELTSLFQADFESAVAALRGRTRIAALTRGERGSVVLSGENAVEVPAEPVSKVLDTTGAGDQYAAGFLYGLSHHKPLAECGRLGSIAAAEVIGHYGPRPQTSLAELARAAGLQP